MIADDPKAVFLGTMARELHRSGVATDGLEETLGDIAETIGLQVQIFALPTQITIAVGPMWNQRIVLLRLPPGRVNLRKLSLLNSIYDRLRAGDIDYREASVLVSDIDRRWPGRNALWEIPALTLARNRRRHFARRRGARTHGRRAASGSLPALSRR